MRLTPGTILGHYRIEGHLGHGGMGEVYKARDSRLDRVVAVKILLEHISQQSDARARFEREAQTIARLNHPHICVLHDVGRVDETDFLVMELLEGETLARRLERGPLPVNEAIQHGIEIADALDKAHRQGVTHRDLKPSNVMLTRTGVKLLDFGLAKLRDSGPLSVVSAITHAEATAQGVLVGTLQYMAPEQVEGREADSRSDIFALGTVLYEMATGTKAFEGKSQAGLIGAILERQPAAPSSVQPVVPRALDGLIAKCLAKDPEERWQSAGDLATALKWIAEPSSAPAKAAETVPRTAHRAARLPVVIAVAFAALAGAFASWWFLSPQAESALTIFPVFPPEGGVIESAFSSAVQQLIGGAVSPNGRKIAFTSKDASGRILIWIRSLDALSPVPVAGTEGAGAGMFWSPDSEYLAFFSQGWLRKVKVSGGPVEKLAPSPVGRGGTWNRDGTIVFAPNESGPLYRVSSGGGDSARVTDLAPGQSFQTYPKFLPDGRRFTYYGGAALSSPAGVYLASLDSPSGQFVVEADSSGSYAEPDHLLFLRQGILFAQRFDGTRVGPENAKPLAASGSRSMVGAPAFSVSDNGVLTYRTGPNNSSDVELIWFDRKGTPLNSLGDAAGFRGVELARDEKRIAVHKHEGSGGDSFIREPNGQMTKVTAVAAQDNSVPLWSPIKDNEMVFSSLRNGKWGLYLVNGAGREELLVESELPKVPMSWSPDGKFVVYTVTDPKTLNDLWILPLDEPAGSRPLISSPYNETHAQISPNGRWIAYVSNETGSDQIWVQSFPSGDRRPRQVTTTDARFPRWRVDGKELFYRDYRARMIAVEVDGSGAEFKIGEPTVLFTANAIYPGHSGGSYYPYAVSSDGQRFLLSIPPGAVADAPLSPITVVLNWQRLLTQ